MAKYLNREVSIVSYPVEEYTVVIKHEDGTDETVKLKDVVLSKTEAKIFLQLETAKLERKKETTKVEGEPKESATKLTAKETINPFSRKAM